MNGLHVSVSPHIHSRRSTRGIMTDVIIALLPASVAGIVIFGWQAAVLLAVCIASSVAAEALFCVITRRKQTVGDLSAVVTGLLLGLNLPTSCAVWQAAVGSIFAIVAVKCLFGGIGQNFANPAITARIMMLLCFGTALNAPASGRLPDFVSAATPLSIAQDARSTYDYATLFFGNYGGSIGETCTLALCIGAVYLLVRRVITWHTPVAFLGGAALLSLALGQDPLYQLMSGGILLGAVFMATDYATTPATKWGKFLFGLGCAVITVAIRTWGNYPEGTSFAILFMNILTPYLDRLTRTKPLGGAK